MPKPIATAAIARKRAGDAESWLVMDGEIASLSSEVAVSADLAAAPADIAETPAGPFRIARSRHTAATVTNSASMESIPGCRAASAKKWKKTSEAAARTRERRPHV